MTILKNFFRYIFFMLLGGAFIAVLWFSLAPKSDSSQIAIFSSFSHPLFDDCAQSCTAFLESLESPSKVVVYNAEDNIAKAKKIARSLHSQSHVHAIITLGSLATKIMSQIEKTKPIIYAEISNKDLSNLQKETNLYGINTSLDIGRCCFAIQTIVPSIDTLIYLRPIEHYPTPLQKEITEQLHALGIKVSEFTVSSNNIKNRVHQVIEKKPAAIFIPFSSLSPRQEVEEILRSEIPVITTDATLIAKGACIACSIDYAQSGKQLAQMAHYILHHRCDSKNLKTVLNEPIPATLTYNEQVLQLLGIQPHDATQA